MIQFIFIEEDAAFVRKFFSEFAAQGDSKVIKEGSQLVIEVITGIGQEDIVFEAWDVTHWKKLLLYQSTGFVARAARRAPSEAGSASPRRIFFEGAAICLL